MKEQVMILTIDIGNTNTHAAIFQKNKILAELRFASDHERTPDEVWLYLKSFFDGKTVSAKQIEGVVISSVVPVITEAYVQASKLHLHHTPVIVSGTLDIGMAIHYDEPSTLGADRICAAIAAFQRYGGPSIIVDFGTATTFDAVSKKGEFLGGVIAPGIQTAATELFRKTTQLTNV
ncbi:MAG TPA: type III pantothenate kinase, partial [Bacteroidota bacterium]|nr:type III pantothenate kinase [Bacteroidota bacterium]